MINEDEAVRDDGKDELFKHLRAQDVVIAENSAHLNARLDKLCTDVAFLVEINNNLKGLAEFIKRWGGRISAVMRWIMRMGARLAPLVAIYGFFRDPINAWLKRIFQ